jgi:hypothetical protein
VALWVVLLNVQVVDVIEVAAEASCVSIVADIASAGPLFLTATLYLMWFESNSGALACNVTPKSACAGSAAGS